MNELDTALESYINGQFKQCRDQLRRAGFDPLDLVSHMLDLDYSAEEIKLFIRRLNK